MASKETKLMNGLYFLLVLAAIYFTFFGTDKLDGLKNSEPVEWQTSYQTRMQANLLNYEDYVANTDYYDYNNEVIASAADKISAESSSSREAIEKTLDYVYGNVQYVWGESDNNCFDGTAPVILASGKGQCDTQSMVVIAMLRRMGIASTPVGGCIVVNSEQCLSQSLYLQSLQFFGQAPKFTRLDFELDPDAEAFSRGWSLSDLNFDVLSQSALSRDDEARAAPKGFSRNGGLHAWVSAWTPEEGWLVLESTTGKIADTTCYIYHVEIFPDNNQKEDLCVSKSYDYAKACQVDDIVNLDKNGLGDSNEVDPN